VKTLKSMDVSPTLAIVAVDYLVSECDHCQPNEAEVVSVIEDGVASYGSASRLMTAWLDRFGPSYTPGQELAKLNKQKQSVCDTEEFKAKLTQAWAQEWYEQTMLDFQRAATKSEAFTREKVSRLVQLSTVDVTIDKWSEKHGLENTLHSNLCDAVRYIPRVTEHRSVTVWF